MFKADRAGRDEEARVPMVATSVRLAVRLPFNYCNHCQLLQSIQIA